MAGRFSFRHLILPELLFRLPYAHRCFQFAYLDRSFQTGRIGTEAWPQTRPLYNRLASLLLHDALPYERVFDKGRIEL